jgi:hypothetical protein
VELKKKKEKVVFHHLHLFSSPLSFLSLPLHLHLHLLLS